MTGLEQELASALEPARAPASLWYRVEAALPRESGTWTSGADPTRWANSGLAAALAAACVMLVWLIPHNQAVSVHEEFVRHQSRLDLGKCQPSELHDWLAHNTGLAVKLAARPVPDPDRIELTGARRLAAGVAAIFYRVDKYPVTLLVGRGGAEAPKHVARRNLERAGLTLFQWEAHGQTYTLVSAVPGGSQQACHICHV